MPRVEFHTGVADELDFACRLLRKASRGGVRLVVTATPALLLELDRALWTFEERGFLPHVLVRASVASDGRAAALLARTPIWLLASDLPPQHPQTLLNLGAEIDSLAERFERIVEVVSPEPDLAAAARRRWRWFREQGYEVLHHAAGKGSAEA